MFKIKVIFVLHVGLFRALVRYHACQLSRINLISVLLLNLKGAIEGQYFKTTGNLRKFSDQDLIDCNINDHTGNWGCNVSSLQTHYVKYLKFQKSGWLHAYCFRIH